MLRGICADRVIDQRLRARRTGNDIYETGYCRLALGSLVIGHRLLVIAPQRRDLATGPRARRVFDRRADRCSNGHALFGHLQGLIELTGER